MNFTDIFIRRPVLATVISLMILVVGLKALTTLPVLQYPRTENAVVTVSTTYYGASADVVAGFITTPLENAIAQANGIDYMTSSSATSVSTITVNLRLNYDSDKALTEISTKINSVLNQLPPGSQQPVLTIQIGQTIDAMYIGFNSDVLPQNNITDYLLRVVQPKLQSVEGVQTAEILGAQNFALRAWLNPQKLAGYGLTATDINTALSKNDYISGLGNTKGQMVQINLNASTDLHSLDEFRNLIVKQKNGAIVRLKDVANVTLGSDDYESRVGFDGKQAVYIGIQVAPAANLLDVVAGVRKVFPDIQSQLPQGINGNVVYDSTAFVTSSIHEVESTLVEALIIVAFVVFIFIGSPRAVAIPLIAIPLSLIGAFIFMLMFHFSVNLLTLLALVLGIGLVVDDAIIMVENVERHMEEGMTPLNAAIQAARELAGPIVAMTIVLVAVYVPIGFQGGLTGALFSEFAFTLVGAVTISAVVALTLSPMMCAYILKPGMEDESPTGRRIKDGLARLFYYLYGPQRPWYFSYTLAFFLFPVLILTGFQDDRGYRFITAPLAAMRRWYGRNTVFLIVAIAGVIFSLLFAILSAAGVLPKAVADFLLVVTLICALPLAPMFLYIILFFPSLLTLSLVHFVIFLFREDNFERHLRGSLNYTPVTLLFALLVISSIYFLYSYSSTESAPQEDQGVIITLLNSAPNSTLQQRLLFDDKVYKIFSTYPETDHVFQLDTAGNSIAGMVLKPWDQRKRTSNVLQPLVQGDLSKIAGVKGFAFQPPPLPGSNGLPFQFVIQTTQPFAQLNEVSTALLAEAQKSGMFIVLDNDLKIDQPQATVEIDREKTSEFGLTMSDVGSSLSSMLGGGYTNYFSLSGRSYKVIPQVGQADRLNIDQLNNYYVSTSAGTPVPLSTVAHISMTTVPETLKHFQQQNAATISGVAYPGVTLGDAIKFMQGLAARTLPAGYTVDYGGLTRQTVQESTGFIMTFVFALIIIFLTLAAQFESFRDPLIILISVPMSIAGALIFICLGIGGASINIYTQVGLVTLMGLISKHGILITEFANNLQHEGHTKLEAIVGATRIRLRPILMTTAAMVLGVLPLITASGAGALSRFDMGLVIASGLSIGTLFTLFVVPAVYMMLAADHHDKPKENREIASPPR